MARHAPQRTLPRSPASARKWIISACVWGLTGVLDHLVVTVRGWNQCATCRDKWCWRPYRGKPPNRASSRAPQVRYQAHASFESVHETRPARGDGAIIDVRATNYSAAFLSDLLRNTMASHGQACDPAIAVSKRKGSGNTRVTSSGPANLARAVSHRELSRLVSDID